MTAHDYISLRLKLVSLTIQKNLSKHKKVLFFQFYLNVSFHFLNGRDKVIISTVDFVFTPRPRCVWHARPEPVGVLPHQVVVQAVLERTKDDDGTGELEVNLLHGLVCQDGDGSC